MPTFFGRCEAGRPVLGAAETDGGYRAGRFDATGQVVADSGRSTAIQAFDTAAAARTLAQGLRRAGKAASARYDENKARQRAEQLDRAWA